MHNAVADPWPNPTINVATARLLLRYLAGLAPAPVAKPLPALPYLAAWLIAHGLGPLAYARCQSEWPQLAAYLQADAFSAAAETGVHGDNLARIRAAFAAADLPPVLLKGAALAETVYGGPAERTMSDLDLWVRAEDMSTAFAQMRTAGFRAVGQEERPPALQMLSKGEIRFYRPQWPQGLVELHLSPFPGWWLQRTAAVNDEALWARLEPLPDAPHSRQLAAEDMIIHVAVHTAVNHQFGLAAVRSLLDITLTAQTRAVDWTAVAQRARAWRVATAVWQTLDLLVTLVGVTEARSAAAALRPAAARRALLGRFVTPASVLAGADMRHGAARLLFLLLLVDRPQDVARLVGRTLWPEPAWLVARYGAEVGHGRHLWRLLTKRSI